MSTTPNLFTPLGLETAPEKSRPLLKIFKSRLSLFQTSLEYSQTLLFCLRAT